MAPSRRTDPSPLLRRAAEALQAGDLVTAERACRTVLKAAPNHPAGLHLLGLTAKRAGHPEAAADLFRKAVAAAPRYAEAWVNLGRSLLDAGRMEEARDSYRKALQARPHFLPAELGLAQVLKAAGDVAGARTVLEDAQREHPEMAAPCLDLANLLQEQGELAAAIATYGEALDRDESLTAARSNRAAAYLKTGEPEKALADAEAYLARGARSANVVAYRVLALQHLGRHADVRAWADPDTMVYPRQPETPPGFAAELEAAIRAHPDLTEDWDPSRRAARGGKVVPDLSRHPTETTALFLEKVRQEVAAMRDSLPDEPGHPFFGSKPQEFRLICWANILAPGGHQAAHIHNYGWVSGVFYPSLPPEIGEESPAGWIAFGEPGYGLPAAPGTEPRLLKPEPGRMLLFPSYLWHHTVPLDTGSERISIAFDVIPS